MYIIIWIIVAIVMFSIIVLIHEWWHFAAARKFWVRVEEFWLWIPPRAKKLFYDKKGTLFSLNWLPIWGFVKLTWETPNTFNVYNQEKKLYNNFDLEKDIKDWKDIFDIKWTKLSKAEKEEILKSLDENNAEYNLANKPSWQQAIIILAWIFMNFVLAWFIFFVLFLIWVSPIWINSKIETDLDLKLIPTYEQAVERWLIIKNPWLSLYPIEWSIAEKSWLKEWDILYEVATCKSKMLDHVICEWSEDAIYTKIQKPEQVIDIVKNNAWKDIAFYINTNVLNEEDAKKYDSPYLWWAFVKVSVAESWKIWTYLWENVEINEEYKIKYSIVWAFSNSFVETKNQIILTFKWLWIILQKIFNPETPEERQEAIQSVSWPIWIVDFISKSISAWVTFIMVFAAIISISLWVFNLLPIPALDGWRFIFITINWLIQKIFGKKAISEKVEAVVHFWFFVLLIALSIIIAYNDINKIIAN